MEYYSDDHSQDYLNDYLLEEKRALNEEEAKYRDIFIALMRVLCYVLKEGEKFIQCIWEYPNEKDKYRFYCPYWFISNYGYIVSVYNETFYYLKPYPRIGGITHKDKNGNIINTSEYYPDYLRRTLKDWEEKAESGKTPQHFFYKNSYPYTNGLGTVKKYNVIMHQIMAFYFCENGDKVLDKDYVIHHKYFKDFSKAPQLTNNAYALQVLLNLDGKFDTDKYPHLKKHNFIHNVGKATTKDKMDKLFGKATEKAESGEIPSLVFTSQEEMLGFVLSGLKPDSPIAFSGKDEEGKTVENAYFEGKDIKIS